MSGVYKPPVVVQANDYDPWGVDIGSFQQNSYNNFKYSGKERITDFNLGWDNFGARMYSADIGRWSAVDIMADKLKFSSPYVFNLNNPLKYVDPSGAFPILISTRAFAPFNWFGANTWKGDGSNRRFSTADNQGFRIAQNTKYETTTQLARNEAIGAQSESSYGASAFSEAEVSPSSSKGNRLISHLSGDNDALIPGADGLGFGVSPTWDIDVHTDFEINVTKGEGGNQVLNISGAIGGDLFPSVESFVKDAKGNGIFLGVIPANYGPNDGPFRGLGGDKKAEGTKVNVSILVNKEGHFIGVMQNGKRMTIKAWNKQFEKQNPVNDGANQNGG